jgi:hypothetical protein
VVKQEKRYTSLGKTVAAATWIFVVILSTVFLVIGGQRHETLTGLWFGILACFWLTFGATVLISQNTNQRSLAMHEELDAVKRQLRELQTILEGRRP